LEEAKPDKPKSSLWMLPWRVVRFFGRLAAGCFVAVGVFVVLAIVGYVQFEEIVEAIDSRYSAEIDDHLGIDKATIARLRDPATSHSSPCSSPKIRRPSPAFRHPNTAS
jgi:hypothetical protein